MSREYNPNLNRHNLQLLINHLEKIRPANFDMDCWVLGPALNSVERKDIQHVQTMVNQMETTGGCGTTACIAGHAAIIGFAWGEIGGFNYGTVADNAKEWLGLDDDQADKLFLPESRSGGTRQATIPKVLSVLKNLHDTGRVDWKVRIDKYQHGTAKV
jgi:hypothetical protein